MAKRVWAIIGVFSVLRIILASILELGNDESYYWLYSQHLQWNYFDHPPLVALGIRIFTLNLALDQYELFVRLSSIVSCAVASWFMYKAVLRFCDERAALVALILYHVSFYTGIVAGFLVMPDAPQMLCWTFCLWMIAKLTTGESTNKNWILFGIGAGLCIMSKVHGAFLWIGLGAYILVHKREWLKQSGVYFALLLTGLIASPILIWNWQYEFVTWKFHSERVDITEQLVNKDSVGSEMLGQVLVNNPINFILIVLAVVWVLRKKIKMESTLLAYNYIAIPMALLLIVISFFRDIWPHWSGPAYTTLIPLAALYITTYKRSVTWTPLLKTATAVFLLFLIAWPAAVYLYPGTFGQQNRNSLGRGDVTLDRYGWEDAGDQFYSMYVQQQRAAGSALPLPVICSKWWGAHIEYYFCNEGDIPVIGLGDVGQLHQYAWLNRMRAKTVNLNEAYCILSSIEENENSNDYLRYFTKMEKIKEIPVMRNGKVAHTFFVYRLSGWQHRPVPVPGISRNDAT